MADEADPSLPEDPVKPASAYPGSGLPGKASEDPMGRVSSRISIDDAIPVNLVRPYADAHTEIGADLAKKVLVLLGIYLGGALIIFFVGECSLNSRIKELTDKLVSTPGPDLVTKGETIRAALTAIIEPAQNSRTALVEFHKLVVVNVIFPLLTALFGYIFGMRSARNDEP